MFAQPGPRTVLRPVLPYRTSVISAQALVDLTEMMVLNTQQYMSDEYYQKVGGSDSLEGGVTTMEATA